MIDIPNHLAFPLVVISVAFVTWFVQKYTERDRYYNSRFFFHIDRVVSMAAVLAIAFFTIYLIVAWASLISNLGLLETHENFKFFRVAVDQFHQGQLVTTIKTTSTVLIVHVTLSSLLALMVNLRTLWLGCDPPVSKRWPDKSFAFLALVTALAFFPYYVQYKYGAPTSLWPRRWSDKEHRYLDPARTTPSRLVNQWVKGPGYMTFSFGVILLDICIVYIAHVFTTVVQGWLPPRTQPTHNEGDGIELQAIAPSPQPGQSAEPDLSVPPAAVSRSTHGRAPEVPPSERNPFNGAHEIGEPPHFVQAQHHPHRNPFNDENEIERLPSHPAPPYSPRP